ncbi:MAG: GNAT family N-acetyltransferase [bacterium]
MRLKNLEIELINRLNPGDLIETTNWLTSTKELSLISDIKNNMITPEELNNWFINSKKGVVTKHNDKIIGIATLTNKEANLPDKTMEICHLIVKPDYRRYYNGSQMVLKLMSFAKEKEYNKVIGRVVKQNYIGKSLLEFLHWHHTENGMYDSNIDFHWFEKKLT